MAYCPKCRGEIGAQETVCPHCEYDFPPSELRATGFAFSGLAAAILVTGQLAAGMACALFAIAALTRARDERWDEAILFGAVGVPLMLGLIVVFARSARVK